MFRAVQSSRSLSLSAVRQQDLIQQAFVKKIREYAQKGGDLASSDPNVKKALQDELSRLAAKFQLTSTDVVAKLPTKFETPKVESALSNSLEGKTLQDLIETLNKDKSAYQREREAKKAAERQRSGNPQ
ncbi:hypothetical protein WR25_21323 [Diploscapter pachys]|uniref:Uncharacterized protein n=1 Tax=Diploscapter pachys TaxID=2018661 RepID=A0A2A2J401_9BILA|nr:hypothetical protein WR25_21323 [Diploscapter pachys]